MILSTVAEFAFDLDYQANVLQSFCYTNIFHKNIEIKIGEVEILCVENL